MLDLNEIHEQRQEIFRHMDREYDPDNDDPVSIRGRSRTFFLPIFVILVIFFRLAALFSIWLVYRGNRGG